MPIVNILNLDFILVTKCKEADLLLRISIKDELTPRLRHFVQF